MGLRPDLESKRLERIECELVACKDIKRAGRE
jgi:hypothetical protein